MRKFISRILLDKGSVASYEVTMAIDIECTRLSSYIESCMFARKITMQQKRPILLGSQSPRRSYLMKEAGYEVRIETIDVDESFPASLDVEKVAEYISMKKASAYLDLLVGEEMGVVADTIVHLEGDILGKPKDKEHAASMLRRMSGTKHDVFTGVTLLDREKQVSFTGHSEVFFEHLTDAEIEYYIESCQPYDKAGSYGIQEWIGYTKIEKIIGSYSNIMGLPMHLIYKNIQKF